MMIVELVGHVTFETHFLEFRLLASSHAGVFGRARVGRDEIRGPLKKPAWEANSSRARFSVFLLGLQSSKGKYWTQTGAHHKADAKFWGTIASAVLPIH